MTKLDLARHYEGVARVMLPYVSATRPLALQAFPDGIDGKGFFMKNVPKYFPDWVDAGDGGQARRHGDPRAGRGRGHAGLPGGPERGDAAHLALARGRAAQPDRLILDFDPSGGGFADVRAAARDAGDRLRDAGLEPYAMVTGSRGIHVVCPLRRGAGFDEVHTLRAGDGRGDGGATTPGT